MESERCLYIMACIAAICLMLTPETYDWLVSIL